MSCRTANTLIQNYHLCPKYSMVVKSNNAVAACNETEIWSIDKKNVFWSPIFLSIWLSKIPIVCLKVCPTYCPMMNGGMNQFLKDERILERNNPQLPSLLGHQITVLSYIFAFIKFLPFSKTYRTVCYI